ncbi:YebC/PmpR family DNA-binding transcriptional regulator [Kytococcus sedentarius]|uniref:YebC/PmpR family DNA-binding transcriptional regulator n=1 Tax=Kytococcus sedentarius TaxID=1276 RepID=UPI0035BBD1D5
MAGHSKWATTKHKKAAIDAKRGKLFAKLVKNIEVAARTGGGDPAGNPTLFDAIQKAKKNSVPNDNIDRAVKRGSGAEAGGAEYQALTYEGYAPGGVGLIIECLSDNKNRAVMEVRTALTRNGGQMADSGSVTFNFHRKGVIVVGGDQKSEDELMEIVLEAGAEELTDLGEGYEVTTDPSDMVDVRTALQQADVDYDSADVKMLPITPIELDAEGARKLFRLIDALEDCDDVQEVYAAAAVPDAVLAELDED